MNDLIKRKIALFSNTRYILPYQTILRNINEEYNHKHTKKLSSFHSHSKHNIIYWHEVIKALFYMKKQFGINYLAFCYLTFKAKEDFPKFVLISKREKVPIDIVISKYFELSLAYSEKRRATLNIISSNKKKSFCQSQKLFKSTKAYFSFDNKRSLIDLEQEKKENDNKKKNNKDKKLNLNDEEEEEKNKHIFNIFVGKLNIKSFLRQEQTFKLEKGDFCQYFIVSDKDQNKSNRNSTNNYSAYDQLRRAQSNKNHKMKYSSLLSMNYTKKLTSSSSFHHISTYDPLSNHQSSFKDKIILKKQNEVGNSNKKSETLIRLQKIPNNNSFMYPAKKVSTVRSNLHVAFLNKQAKTKGNVYENIISNKYSSLLTKPLLYYNQKETEKTKDYMNKDDLYY